MRRCVWRCARVFWPPAPRAVCQMPSANERPTAQSAVNRQKPKDSKIKKLSARAPKAAASVARLRARATPDGGARFIRLATERRGVWFEIAERRWRRSSASARYEAQVLIVERCHQRDELLIKRTKSFGSLRLLIEIWLNGATQKAIARRFFYHPPKDRRLSCLLFWFTIRQAFCS